MGDELRCLEKVVKALPDTPVVQTVFSPLAQAKNLAGERLLIDLRQNTADFKAGLETVTQSTIAFVEAIASTGAAGIFYAVQHASANRLSTDEYRLFGREYDLQILHALQRLWFNVVHIHGDHIYFDQVADYPVQVWNWHDRETQPSLKIGLSQIKGAACGGLSRDVVMLRGRPEAVQSEVAEAIEQTGGRRYIVGTGCVMMIPTPEANIKAALAGAGRASSSTSEV